MSPHQVLLELKIYRPKRWGGGSFWVVGLQRKLEDRSPSGSTSLKQYFLLHVPLPKTSHWLPSASAQSLNSSTQRQSHQQLV